MGWRDCVSLRGKELSGSLLGTWAHLANDSSRSRLCRTWLGNTASSPSGSDKNLGGLVVLTWVDPGGKPVLFTALLGG